MNKKQSTFKIGKKTVKAKKEDFLLLVGVDNGKVDIIANNALGLTDNEIKEFAHKVSGLYLDMMEKKIITGERLH